MENRRKILDVLIWKTRRKILDVLSDRVKSMTHSLTVHREVVNRHGQGQNIAPDSEGVPLKPLPFLEV